MKKTFLFLSTLFLIGGANAATPWWQQPTICRLSPTNCYVSMGTGYDAGMWDAGAKCWGLKLICSDALKTSNSDDPIAMGRTEIAAATNINSDFDITVLNSENECFGVRKTASGGATASVNGNFVKVWCNGVLDNPDATLESGEITTGTQPSCATLAENGYVGIQNGKCYGKYYDTSNYYIQCNGETPTLIVLNGVDPDNVSDSEITTKVEADALFNTMYTNAQAQHQLHFND